MQQLNLEIERLDHLGIIASTIKDLGIIKMINDRIGTSNQEVITTGEAVAATVLNGLGFTSEPLYLSPYFLKVNHWPIYSIKITLRLKILMLLN